MANGYLFVTTTAHYGLSNDLLLLGLFNRLRASHSASVKCLATLGRYANLLNLSSKFLLIYLLSILYRSTGSVTS